MELHGLAPELFDEAGSKVSRVSARKRFFRQPATSANQNAQDLVHSRIIDLEIVKGP